MNRNQKKTLFEEITSSVVPNLNTIPHSDDIFDLSNIDTQVLDKSYVRYEPYNLAITYRHPLRCISENTDFKGKIEEAKKIILSTYPLSEEQFIIKEGHNGMYAAILVSVIDNNIEVIENAMLKLGFFRSKPTDEKLLCDLKQRNWADLRFEPTPSNDLTDFVKENYKYVYHLAPSIFQNDIKHNGLNPSNNNPEFKYYEPRVYLIKGNASDTVMNLLMNYMNKRSKKVITTFHQIILCLL